MDAKQEFNRSIDNSTKDNKSAKDNIPDMFKVYDELYRQMIHVIERGIGVDLRKKYLSVINT